MQLASKSRLETRVESTDQTQQTSCVRGKGGFCHHVCALENASTWVLGSFPLPMCRAGAKFVPLLLRAGLQTCCPNLLARTTVFLTIPEMHVQEEEPGVSMRCCSFSLQAETAGKVGDLIKPSKGSLVCARLPSTCSQIVLLCSKTPFVCTEQVM